MRDILLGHLYIFYRENGYQGFREGQMAASKSPVKQGTSQGLCQLWHRGSQISLVDTISSSKLAGKHELVQGFLLGEKTESQPNLRTKATDLEAWETVYEEEVSAHPPTKG